MLNLTFDLPRGLASGTSLWVFVIGLAACGEIGPAVVDAGAEPAPDAGAEPPPETTLTVTPAALGNQAAARFEMTADRPATFVCRVDDDAASPCTSPHEITVADGTHLLAVAAVGLTGAVDPTPAQHTWTVDTVAPIVSIAAMAASTSVRTPELSFTVDGDAVEVACRMDVAAFAPCTSPQTPAAPLAEGEHQFEVEAIDAAGNRGRDVRAFAVDVTPPVVTITSGPPETLWGFTVTATFAWATSSDVATTECRLYNIQATPGAFAPCTSPTSVTGHSPSVLRFEVRVRDTATNSASATREFNVYSID